MPIVNHRSDPIYQAIEAKMAALTAPTTIGQWRYRINPAAGAQAPDYDDHDWQTITPPYTWSSADGEAWMRMTVDLPAEVAGISLAGSAVELNIFLAIGASVYVNGEEKYREAYWSDTSAVPLPLVEHFQPGQPLHLALRCNGGDGFGIFIRAHLRVSALAEALLQLDLLRMQMAFTRFLAEQGSGKEKKRATWKKAAQALDLAALQANDWSRWQESAAAARHALAPFADEAKRYTAHLVAHSHIDMNWLWPWRETVDVCLRDFATMDSLMERYPEFRFSQSQIAVYEATQRHRPDLFERIQARVKEGRWDVTASTWVEGDLNMAAGETLTRQILHARRYLADHFGVAPRICWEPDTFGHSANVPQILQKSGIDYYYFCRAGKQEPLFWWEGVDGSRVLAVQDPLAYNGTVNPREVTESVMDFAGRYGTQRGLYLYGVGDHGGGATARDIETARQIDQTPLLPQAKPSSTVDFYGQALAEAGDLPVVKGELNTVFEGCYTTHADIKRANREGENTLLSAETTAALATLLTGAPYPAEDLAEAWRTVCFHQFHDILCGCAIGVTYREAHERFAHAMATADNHRQRALAALAAATYTGAGEAPCLVVFNPLTWQRADVVRVPLTTLGGVVPSVMVDDEGRHLPAQQVGDDILFVAAEVPALGVRVYRPAVQPPTPDDADAIRVNPAQNGLQNRILSLRVHPASGALDELLDFEAGRNLAGPWPGAMAERKINAGGLNRLQIIWEQPHPMSAWNIGDTTRTDDLITGAQVSVVESGPVRGVIEVRRQFLHSSLRQRIILYRGMRRVDFETEVDWHERGNAHADAPRLRTTFAPYLGQTRATFEVPFAAIERPADGREVPALRWMDLSEADYGVSLLNNGKYGHQAHGNTLGLTLVRASYEPDNNPDEGLHRFTYSLYPHTGTWQEAETNRRAAELNQPLQAVVSDGHRGKVKPGRPGLVCKEPGVWVSGVKLAEDQPPAGQAVIVRLVEMHGRAVNAKVKVEWPLARAEEVDMTESRLSDLAHKKGALRLSFRPHEIKTVKMYTA